MAVSRRRMAVAGMLLLAVGCASSPKIPAFSGLWMKTDENGMTDLVIENSVFVEADGEKFRILSRGNEIDDVEVFNGRELISQQTVTAQQEEDEPPVQGSSEAVTSDAAPA